MSEITGSTSDGYHAFDELYDHRVALFIALCRNMFEHLGGNIWRSKLHSDGTMFDGWFVMGIYSGPGKQITYHLPIERWGETEFCRFTTRERAPEWDGHLPKDVLERVKRLMSPAAFDMNQRLAVSLTK